MYAFGRKICDAILCRSINYLMYFAKLAAFSYFILLFQNEQGQDSDKEDGQKSENEEGEEPAAKKSNNTSTTIIPSCFSKFLSAEVYTSIDFY